MKSITRVLLEEDDRSIADFVEPELERLDFSVRCTQDGVSSLEEAKRFGPELVLLDMILPKSPPATSRWTRSTASTSARTTT